MKLLSFATLTVAFLATVTTKFNFGTCPGADLKGLGFSDYKIAASVDHYFAAMDTGLLSLVENVESFGFNVAYDFQCGQLGEYEPWKTWAVAQQTAGAAATPKVVLDGKQFYYKEEKAFTSILNDRDDAVLKMVYMKATADLESEFYYFCVDSLSVPALFEFMQGFGLTPSSSLGGNINSLASIFAKLGLNFKTHGMFINGPRSIALFTNGASLLSALDYNVLIPGYPVVENLAFLNQPKDYCSSLP